MENIKTIAGWLLANRHNSSTPLTGVIHIGAAKCEESDDYQFLGANRVLWIEGNALSAAIGRITVGNIPNQRIVEAFLSHQNSTELFYETVLDSANDSLMKPCNWYADVAVKNIRPVIVRRLDTLLSELNINIANYNTLVVDVQGAELKVLIGCGDILNHINFIAAEAWYDELYIWNRFVYTKGTPISRLKNYLEDIYEFNETVRTPTDEENPHRTHSWIDVLFERK